jgi:hypothetical protein
LDRRLGEPHSRSDHSGDEEKNFDLCRESKPGRPASYPISTGALFPAVKPLGREAVHLLLFIAEYKNAWSYNSTPPYVFMAWCFMKQ